MQSLNYIAIMSITIGTWAAGALWFGPLFGKLWMRVHHGDKKFSASEMAKMSEGMWKLLVGEIFANLLLVTGLAILIQRMPAFSGMHLGLFVWAGFVLPTLLSSVLWGNDQKQYMLLKIVISGSYRLIMLAGAGYLLSIW
jgi:hypothetical protein